MVIREPFSASEREALRGELVARAQSDPEVAGAAHLGSFAVGRADRWSDIDFAICLAPDADAQHVLQRWSQWMYDAQHAVAQHDIRLGSTIYRVFLLANTLQVDLSFWTLEDFGAIGPKFQLIFGAPRAARSIPSTPATDAIGLAWLHALHVRASIARRRLWQADHMLRGMRDQLMILACLRQGMSTHQGRAFDDLPESDLVRAQRVVVRAIEPVELTRAFRNAIEILLDEARLLDPSLAARLEGPMGILAAGV